MSLSMYLFPLKLPIIKKNDPLLEFVVEAIKQAKETLKDGDIVVFSEKVVATSQGRVINLSEVKNVSEKAKKLGKKYELDERFVELILQEATTILGGVPHVLLTITNNFLIANAGIDQSNAGLGHVVLLPKDSEKVAWDYRKKLKEEFKINNLGIIITDSRVQPLRKGTVGVAVATAGFEPVQDLRGKPDIYKRILQIKMRNVADDLTSAAQFLLNEADEQTPLVVIRGANVEFTENPKMTMEIEPENCLYFEIFSKYFLNKKKTKR